MKMESLPSMEEPSYSFTGCVVLGFPPLGTHRTSMMSSKRLHFRMAKERHVLHVFTLASPKP